MKKLYERCLALPEFLQKFCAQVLKVRQMKLQRREFLGEIVQRELKVMMDYYKAKKKPQNKKILKNLVLMKEHNLEKILNDYYFKVCYAFYKR